MVDDLVQLLVVADRGIGDDNGPYGGEAGEQREQHHGDDQPGHGKPGAMGAAAQACPGRNDPRSGDECWAGRKPTYGMSSRSGALRTAAVDRLRAVPLRVRASVKHSLYARVSLRLRSIAVTAMMTADTAEAMRTTNSALSTVSAEALKLVPSPEISVVPICVAWVSIA